MLHRWSRHVWLTRSHISQLAMVAGIALFGAGCTSGDRCEPACEGRVCGDDGCGGICGTCVEGADCLDGLCVDPNAPAECAQSCEALGYQCGEHCGASCGECAEPTPACVDHNCRCVPQCWDRLCGEVDGCGGVCPCAADRTCDACPLRLIQVTDELLGGNRFATLALDFSPTDGMPSPGMADIRFEVSGPARLERVALARPLVDSGKELFVHPHTGQAFQETRPGVYRLLVTSTRNRAPLGAGRWMYLRLSIEPERDPEAQAVQVRLVREAQVLAPAAADEQVSELTFLGSVVVPLGGSDGR